MHSTEGKRTEMEREEEKGKEWEVGGGKGKDLEFIHTPVVINVMGLDCIYKDVSILKSKKMTWTERRVT